MLSLASVIVTASAISGLGGTKPVGAPGILQDLTKSAATAPVGDGGVIKAEPPVAGDDSHLVRNTAIGVATVLAGGVAVRQVTKKK